MNTWIINPYDLNEEFRVSTYPELIYGMYAVSNFGNVYNMVKRFYCSKYNHTGYYRCKLKTLTGDWCGILVHRLVAWEFCLENRDINLEVNHKDGNRINNHYTNLEWVTQSQNVKHAYDTGLKRHPIGELNPRSKLTNDAVLFIRGMKELHLNSIEIACLVKEEFGIDIAPGTINHIFGKRQRWKHVH